MVCVSDIIRKARKHVGDNAEMESSARLRLSDAVLSYDAGDFNGARIAALDSLRYSVGILSNVYQNMAAD